MHKPIRTIDPEVIRRAEEAKRILESDVFHEAMRSVRDRIFENWANSRTEDSQRREMLYAEYSACSRILGELTKHIQEMKIQTDRLAQELNPQIA